MLAHLKINKSEIQEKHFIIVRTEKRHFTCQQSSSLIFAPLGSCHVLDSPASQTLLFTFKVLYNSYHPETIQFTHPFVYHQVLDSPASQTFHLAICTVRCSVPQPRASFAPFGLKNFTICSYHLFSLLAESHEFSA